VPLSCVSAPRGSLLSLEIMEVVYVLQHLHLLPNGQGDVKFIGVYRSRESALAAIERLGQQPGFSDHPRLWNPEANDDEQGFHIAKYPLDEDHWLEGYVTVGGEE
jgi:hypothetical protein